MNFFGQTLATELGCRLWMDKIIQRHLVERGIVQPGTGLLDLQSRASIWLVRLEFSFEFPRPLMSNMKYIGGFHCRDSNFENIDAELLEFVESSEKGVIILSMGSMVDRMALGKA